MQLLRRIAFPVLGVLITAYSVLLLADTLPGLLHKREQIQALRQETARLKAGLEQKRKLKQDLEENPAVIERNIRCTLKLNKPGETTYIGQGADESCE